MSSDLVFDEKTIVGFDDGTSSMSLDDIIPDAPPVSPLEVVFDRVTVEAGTVDDSPYRALEIWTQNRVYLVDSTLTCVEVVDRSTGQRDPRHAVLGTKLVGGQRRYDKTIHQSKPFPVPGTEAVFDKPASAGRRVPALVTSKVERTVLHIRVTSVVLRDDNPFDDVTSALLVPPRPPGR